MQISMITASVYLGMSARHMVQRCIPVDGAGVDSIICAQIYSVASKAVEIAGAERAVQANRFVKER